MDSAIWIESCRLSVEYLLLLHEFFEAVPAQLRVSVTVWPGDRIEEKVRGKSPLDHSFASHLLAPLRKKANKLPPGSLALRNRCAALFCVNSTQ